MRVVKSFGNNAALCVDGKNRELIALGLGIGFPKCPYELTDMKKIDKTFYGVDGQYYDMLESIDHEIVSICADIIDLASTMLNVPLNPNAVFTLADHINFAITRLEKGINFTFPLSNEFQDLYPVEVKIAKHTLSLIKKAKKITLPSAEIYGIAMNLINSQERTSASDEYILAETIIKRIVLIVESKMNTIVDKNSFNYSRFASHMHYLLKRRNANLKMDTMNQKIYHSLIKEYPKTYQCVLEIKKYLALKLNWNAGDEELLYLILHVNRLCSIEGCNE